jgi:hypothetical protein
MTAKRQKNPAEPPQQVPGGDPNAWDRSHGTYIAGRAHIDDVDAMAIAMEDTWGVDRLRLLVPLELREKFDRQRYRLGKAILGGSLEDVRIECSRMKIGWMSLHAAALQVGAKPLDPEVWEVALADGTVAAIVKDNTAAHRVVASGRQMAVYALEEVARLLDHHQGVLNAKMTFPGATVVASRKSVQDPLKNIHRASDFDSLMDD